MDQSRAVRAPLTFNELGLAGLLRHILCICLLCLLCVCVFAEYGLGERSDTFSHMYSINDHMTHV